MEKLKLKPLNKQQLLISIDRLTRFKHPETKYMRVFKEIITSNLIHPKYKKNELDEMDYARITELAEKIINASFKSLGLSAENEFTINQKLYEYENTVFALDANTQKLLKNKINYNAVIPLIDDKSPLNLKWLKALSANGDAAEIREEKSLRFPLSSVIITEGITEEILLPEFAKLCGYDFDKKGVYIISAGGKNQVVKLFYKIAETLKLPIFVLLDNDAKENLNEIRPKLRKNDKVHLLKCGEFEDLLPLPLVQKTLNYALKNISIISQENLKTENGMVKTLEEIFRNRGMHEFKKSEFAALVKQNITSKDDISEEINDIIDEIKNINTLTRNEITSI